MDEKKQIKKFVGEFGGEITCRELSDHINNLIPGGCKKITDFLTEFGEFISPAEFVTDHIDNIM